MPQPAHDHLHQEATPARLRAPSDVERSFVHRVLIGVSVSAATILLLGLFYAAFSLLLLLFGGLLFGVFLHRIAVFLETHTRFSYRWSVGASLILLLTLFGGAFLYFLTSLIQSFSSFETDLGAATQHFYQSISAYPIVSRIIDELPSLGQLLKESSGGMFNMLSSIFSGALGLLLGGVVILFTGFYTALEPGSYRMTLIRLFPLARRQDIAELLTELKEVLWSWSIGRLGSMVITGTLTGVALKLLGIPSAAALGLIAGILTFIPNIGPTAAAIPGLLLAFEQGTTKLLAVLAAYCAVQFVESYFVTPAIQRREVRIPPAFLLSAQLLFGLFAGTIGLIFATPVSAAIGVIVQREYIRGALNESARKSPRN
ncbi:MAG: AI-2E family transporter [Bdellovibrionales bacterium]|nr:AI-2E family transporter [Bdellovibrionales bacterium]